MLSTNLGGFYFGYSLGIFNFSMENILKEFHISEIEEEYIMGLLSALIPIGAILGAIVS